VTELANRTVALLGPVFEAGFFSSTPVHVALAVGTIVTLVSGLVGVFTVARGQSFAGHALSDIGTAGGSAAVLAGVPTIYGFVVLNLAAAGIMEVIGIRRPRGRDLATGIVLGASLGLAALFLYEDTVSSNTTGATVNVLFGSLFTVSPSTVPLVAVLAAACIIVTTVLYRPLLLTSVSYDLAAARGVPVRAVGIAYLLTLAVAVSLSAVTIGAILSTALLIGPAAISLRLTNRPGTAALFAVLVGLVSTWAGILIAYDSTGWFGGKGWPVSFCIVAVIFTIYAATALVSACRSSRVRGNGRAVARIVEEAG
jgi:zinc/manganese transport system permease protein